MLRNFLIYGVGGAASRLAAVFLVPLYTRALTVQAYGTLELLLSIQTGAVLLSGLQTESAILRDYFDGSANFSRKSLVWSGLGISVAGGLAFAAVALIAASAHVVPREVMTSAAALIPLIILSQIFGIQLVIVRCADQAPLYAFLALLDFSLAGILSALLIIEFHLGMGGALLGMLLGKTVCVALAFPVTFGRPPEHLRSPGLVRRMLVYALPTMPSVMLNWAQTNGTRLLLAAIFGLQDLAIVGVGIRVAAIYGFVVQSFRLAWEPHAFRNLDNRMEQERFFDCALQLYLLLMFLAAGAAMLAGPPLVALFAPSEYASAVPLVGLFIVGQFWLGTTSITTMGIHGARVTGKLTKVFGVGALLNALVLVGMAPWLGTAAAAIGFFLSAFASAVVGATYSNRHYQTGLSIRRLLSTFALSAVMATASFAVSAAVNLSAFDWVDFVWRSGVLLAVLTVCGVSLNALIEPEIRQLVRANVKMRVARLLPLSGRRPS